MIPGDTDGHSRYLNVWKKYFKKQKNILILIVIFITIMRVVTLIDVYSSKRAQLNWLILHVQVIRKSWNFVWVLIYSLGQDYEIGRGVRGQHLRNRLLQKTMTPLRSKS